MYITYDKGMLNWVFLTGVGYKKDQGDNWIAHQDDFNTILANLNEGNSEQQASVSSIESASKKSRSRVQSVFIPTIHVATQIQNYK